MNNKGFGLAVFLGMVCALLSMPHMAQADELSAWQKGVIEGALNYNSHIRSDRLRVEINNGSARLSGYVDSDVGRALAEQIALSVKGVHTVHNQLTVAPQKWPQQQQRIREIAGDTATSRQNRLSNVTINNKVKSQLLTNRQTSGMEVDVETHNRVVILRGYVESEAERALTYWVVKNTQGVVEVIDQLNVVSGSRHALMQSSAGSATHAQAFE